MTKFDYEDKGEKDFKECWDYQEKLLAKIKADKKTKNSPSPINKFILVEHPHVYTLGKSGDEKNLLIQPEFLKEINASFYPINRGGDITYHGPGQLVGYPIFDLEYVGIGVREYIEKMEEAIIETIAVYNLTGTRKDGTTGVWLDADIPANSRKICAIGVRVSQYVTMHGFALNVNTDMRYFSYINPCGYQAFGVTSMEKELGRKIDMGEVKELIKKNFNEKY